MMYDRTVITSIPHRVVSDIRAPRTGWAKGIRLTDHQILIGRIKGSIGRDLEAFERDIG